MAKQKEHGLFGKLIAQALNVPEQQVDEALEKMRDNLRNGWHPASELPKEEGVYIVIPPDCEYRDVYYAEYKLPYGWCYDIEEHYHKIEIQWWCYPPKED